MLYFYNKFLEKKLKNHLSLYLTSSQIEFILDFIKSNNYYIHPAFFKKGYRGVVLLLKDKKNNSFILKIKRKDTVKSLQKEYEILKFLENYNLAPKVYYFDLNNQFILMDYIKGITFFDYKNLFKKNLIKKDKFLKYLKNIIKACYILDKLNIFHGELIKGKHIYLYKDKVKFIDFESAKFTKTSKNLTQFIGGNILNDKQLMDILNLKKDDILLFLKKYKKANNLNSFFNYKMLF